MITYNMKSGSKAMLELYEGQILNGQPKGFGRRYYFNRKGIPLAFLGCFNSLEITMENKPGIYFQEKEVYYYGIWGDTNYRIGGPKQENKKFKSIKCGVDP